MQRTSVSKMYTNVCIPLLMHLLQGIEWTNIEYFNNAIICDLIENVSPVSVLGFSCSPHLCFSGITEKR